MPGAGASANWVPGGGAGANWVLGASAGVNWVPCSTTLGAGCRWKKKSILFNYPSKAWIPLINAPVCFVNDHPGEINPIN